MRAHLIALICVCAVVGELAAAGSSSAAWRRYKRQHGKVYGAEEDAMRFARFLATKERVERHNANPNVTYKMALNHMSDWTDEEYRRLNGLRLGNDQRIPHDPSGFCRGFKLMNGPVPDEVDWRKVPNRVSPVKDQGDCGSCWAFAATGLLEGQQVVRNFTSKLIPLSEQELVSCSRANSGCWGGDFMTALFDIYYDGDGGIESEADYKYTGRNDECKEDKSKFVMTVKNACNLETGNEEVLMKAVANYGPVAIGISANDAFQSYHSGIFNDRMCTVAELNHAVLVVGYGTDENDDDYWIIKNSWGANWGEDGYIRVQRGIKMCDIGTDSGLALF